MGRWLETYQTPEEILMTRFKSITTTLLAKYEAENPEIHYDFDSFVKELLTDETSVARVFDMLIRDVYKRTRRQSRASSQGSTSTASPVGPRGVTPVTGAAADPARLARFLQQQSQYSLLRSTSSPRQTPLSDGETPREARDYRLNRDLASRTGRRAVDRHVVAQVTEDMMWGDEATQVRNYQPIQSIQDLAREEDKDEDTVVDARDFTVDTVI